MSILYLLVAKVALPVSSKAEDVSMLHEVSSLIEAVTNNNCRGRIVYHDNGGRKESTLLLYKQLMMITILMLIVSQ